MHESIPIRGNKVKPTNGSSLGVSEWHIEQELRMPKILGRTEYFKVEKILNDMYGF